MAWSVLRVRQETLKEINKLKAMADLEEISMSTDELIRFSVKNLMGCSTWKEKILSVNRMQQKK